MRALNLTEEQKTKLLEMCKVLFSEFYLEKVYEGDDIFNQAYLTKSGNFYFDIEIEKYMYMQVEIHWFEFCMLHLAPKILGVSDYKNYTYPIITYIVAVLLCPIGIPIRLMIKLLK